MAGSYSHQSKFKVDAVDMTAVSDTIALRETFVEPVGIAGSRIKASENVRAATRIVTGDLVIEVNPLWLGTLLKVAMGDFTAPTATVQETLPTFTIIKDAGHKVYTYALAKCDKLVINAQKGQPMRATLSIVAPDESVGASGSFGAYAPSTMQPLMLHDLAATLLAVGSRVVDDVTITIQNNLKQDRFFNSATLTEIPEGMHQTMLSLTTPFDATHIDLYRPGVGGIAASLVFTNSTIGATFTFAKWQIPGETTVIPGRDGENLLKLEGEVRKSGATKPLIVTVDSTP